MYSDVADYEDEAMQQFAGHRGLAFSPYIIGWVCDAMLFGIIWMQFTRWWNNSSKSDYCMIRMLVYYLMIVVTAYTITLNTYIIYWFCFHFGQYAIAYEYNWTSSFLLFDCILQTPVSAFFAYRAWRLWNRSKVLLATFSILLLASFVGGMVAKGTATKVYVSIGSDQLIWLGLFLGAGCVLDIIVFITISWALLRTRGDYSASDRVIKKFLIISTEAQLIPTIVALAFLVIVATVPDTNFANLFLWAPKMYVCALFLVLNSRSTLRQSLDPQYPRAPFVPPTLDLPTQDMAFTGFANTPLSSTGSITQVESQNTKRLSYRSDTPQDEIIAMQQASSYPQLHAVRRMSTLEETDEYRRPSVGTLAEQQSRVRQLV